jgi:hypothetical protein
MVELKGRLSLQRVAPWHGTMLVMMATTSAACFYLLSHVVEVGGVLCRVRCFCSEVCSYVGVYFGPLCINDVSSYITQQCSTLFKKTDSDLRSQKLAFP